MGGAETIKTSGEKISHFLSCLYGEERKGFSLHSLPSFVK